MVFARVSGGAESQSVKHVVCRRSERVTCATCQKISAGASDGGGRSSGRGSTAGDQFTVSGQLCQVKKHTRVQHSNK